MKVPFTMNQHELLTCKKTNEAAVTMTTVQLAQNTSPALKSPSTKTENGSIIQSEAFYIALE